MGMFYDSEVEPKEPQLKQSGAKSKVTSTNPKDLLGVKKPSLTKIPAVAIAHESLAMMDGAFKYGPYNWRDKAVKAMIYIDACRRHIDAWVEGQEEAEDSLVHHLGHARACLGILLDAMETGNMIDDRPVTEASAAAYKKLMKRLELKIAEKNARTVQTVQTVELFDKT